MSEHLPPSFPMLETPRLLLREVVEADVANAGAEIIASPSNIVVDGDLVTGKSYREAGALADAIAERILALHQADVRV
jgi:protease I